VHARELLKQLGSSAFLDRRSAVDDEVLAQAGRLDPGSLEGDRYPGIAPNILELSQVRIQMRREQLVALAASPGIGFYAIAIAVAVVAPQVAAFGYLLIAVVGVLRVRGDETAAEPA
jgi:hypothetical protein